MEQKIDPITGEAVGEEVNSDPMSEEAVKPEVSFVMMSERAADAAQQESVTNSPKKKPDTKILFAILGTLVIIAVVFLVVKSGLFLSNREKVALAAYKTAQDQPQFVRDLNQIQEISLSNDYTMAMEGNYDNTSFHFTYASNNIQKQLKGVLDIGIIRLDLIAGLTSDSLKLKFPSISKKVLTYNYKQNNTGYLIDIIGEDTIKDIDKALANQTSSKNQEAAQKEFNELVEKEFKKLEFKKIAKKEFLVNGSQKKSQGYEFILTHTNVENILDGMKEVFGDDYEELLQFYQTGSQSEDVKNSIRNLRDTLSNMKDIRVQCYLYKGKLSAVLLNMEDVEIKLLLEGGSSRTENMRLVVNSKGNEAEVAIKGSSDSDKERYQLSSKNNTTSYDIGEIEYHIKTGDFEISSGLSSFRLTGSMHSEKDLFNVDIDKIRIDQIGNLDASGTLSIKKGASMDEIQGDEFDIGNAAAEDLQELYMEFYDLLSMLF